MYRLHEEFNKLVRFMENCGGKKRKWKKKGMGV